MKRIILFISILGLFAYSCKLENKKSKDSSKKLNIVCTTSIIKDAVLNICDTNANVESLMGAGVDPHLYSPTYSDLEKLKGADVIIYNGLHLEGKMIRTFEQLTNQGKKIIAVAKGISKDKIIKIPEGDDSYDPHIWFDVEIWMEGCEYIAKELADVDSLRAKIFLKNFADYNLKLVELNSWIKSSIDSIPESKRVLITAHDAFSYFGRAYNVKVRGLQGISTLSEPGIKDVSELAAYISEVKIKSIFIENSVSKEALMAVVEGCESRGHIVNIGGELFSDALGNPNTDEGTYIGAVKWNVNQLVKGLKE